MVEPKIRILKVIEAEDWAEGTYRHSSPGPAGTLEELAQTRPSKHGVIRIMRLDGYSTDQIFPPSQRELSRRWRVMDETRRQRDREIAEQEQEDDLLEDEEYLEDLED